jgi:hypothetical protein
MKRSKEEYENLINNSSLFLIEKKKDGELYAAEERRFLKDLAEYLSLYIYAPERFTETGLEIIETAKSCIKAYNSQTGEFLHYFNKALANTLRVASGKKAIQEARSGMKLTRSDNVLIRKVYRFALLKGYDLSEPTSVSRLRANENMLHKIAEICCVTKADVLYAIRVQYETEVLGEFTANDDGDEASIFDRIKQGLSPDVILERHDDIIGLLKSVSSAYINCRDSQKPLLKKLISIKLIPLVLEIESIQDVPDYDFWDSEIEKQYRKNGKVPTARDIAKLFGVMEQSVSRTGATFFKKVAMKC